MSAEDTNLAKKLQLELNGLRRSARRPAPNQNDDFVDVESFEDFEEFGLPVEKWEPKPKKKKVPEAKAKDRKEPVKKMETRKKLLLESPEDGECSRKKESAKIKSSAIPPSAPESSRRTPEVAPDVIDLVTPKKDKRSVKRLLVEGSPDFAEPDTPVLSTRDSNTVSGELSDVERQTKDSELNDVNGDQSDVEQKESEGEAMRTEGGGEMVPTPCGSGLHEHSPENLDPQSTQTRKKVEVDDEDENVTREDQIPTTPSTPTGVLQRIRSSAINAKVPMKPVLPSLNNCPNTPSTPSTPGLSTPNALRRRSLGMPKVVLGVVKSEFVSPCSQVGSPESSEAEKRRTSVGMSKKPLYSGKLLSSEFRSPLAKVDETQTKGRKKKNKAVENERTECDDPLRMKFVDKIQDIFAKGASDHEAIIRRLLSKPFTIPIPGYTFSGIALGMGRSGPRMPMFDPYGENALVLYHPPHLTAHEQLNMKKEEKLVHVVVDPVLGNVLRPHQREGVQFMYDCATGKNIEGYNGCIMADEMGLGKTLQCISLVWTLLRQGPEAKPTFSKAIIVCPSSLVKNWDKEIKKWLGNRVNSLTMDSGSKEEIIMKLQGFMSDSRIRAASPVLIISYETFRIYAKILHSQEIGMVICDEGHRLKNSDNLTYQALNGLKCVRRILISGTPIQNDLLEYFSLVNFVNPGLLGTAAEFKRKFENMILRGRDACASDTDQKKGEEKTLEMTALVSKCIIRRTSILLTKYLPVKYEHIICCRLTELQEKLYKKLIETEKVLRASDKSSGQSSVGGASALSFITHLKKLCNHPALVHEEVLKPDNRFRS